MMSEIEGISRGSGIGFKGRDRYAGPAVYPPPQMFPPLHHRQGAI